MGEIVRIGQRKLFNQLYRYDGTPIHWEPVLNDILTQVVEVDLTIMAPVKDDSNGEEITV